MQPRNTAIAFVIAILLGAFIYLYEIQGEAGREQAEQASRRIFPNLEAEAIESLEFRTQDDRAFLGERAGDGWIILKPVEFPGDNVNLNAIASTLANLTSKETLEAAGAREIYGLGSAARRIQFRVGTQRYGLEIGANTPVGGNVYVARDADPKNVFTAALFRVRSLNRDLDSLRDRRVLSFDRTRVNRIVAGWPGGAVTLEKSAGGWMIVHPIATAGPADDKAVDDLLSDIAFLRADGFVDEGQSAFESDASEAYFSLRLGFEAGEGGSLEAGIRVMTDPKTADFVVRGGDTRALYRVPRARIEAFPREVFAYRFKALSNFETTSVQSFELVFAREAQTSSMEPVTVRVDRIENGWRATGARWTLGAAAGLIAEFARLDAVSVVSEQADEETLASLGLRPPRVMLRAYAALEEDEFEGKAEEEAEETLEEKIEGKSEEQAAAPDGPGSETRKLLAEVSLGTFDPDHGIYARARGQTAVFRLDAGLAEQIPVDLEAYQSRFLAPPPAEIDAEIVPEPPAEPAPE